MRKELVILVVLMFILVVGCQYTIKDEKTGKEYELTIREKGEQAIAPVPQPSPGSEPTKPVDLSDCQSFLDRYNYCGNLLKAVTADDPCIKKYGEDTIERFEVPSSDKKCYELVECIKFTDDDANKEKRRSCMFPEGLPDKCTLPSGVSCLDFKGTASTVTLVIQNSAGFDMQNVVVMVNSTANNGNMACTAAGDTTLTDGEKDTFTCTSAGLDSGKYKGTLNINYLNAQTGMSHTKQGELIINIK